MQNKQRNIERSYGYSYCNYIILLCCNFFVSSCTSYRGSSKILATLSEDYSIQTPHYNSIRIWVLKLGFFKLTYAKEYRNDWIFIIDFTITIGIKKCMVILGTPLSKLEERGYNLRFEDVEVLHLSVSMHYNYQKVENALSDVSNNVGVPVEIISDYGSDVKKGIDSFCKKHQNVHFVYDVTHLSACVLKKYMEKDDSWSEISKKITSTIQQTKQSILSFLCPPSPRKKSRFLNLEGIMKWSNKLSQYVEVKGMGEIQNYLKQYGHRDKITKRRKFYKGSELKEKSIELFNEKFGWVAGYEEKFQLYQQYIDIISRVKGEVGKNGLNKQNIEKIEDSLKETNFTDKARELKNELLSKLREYVPKGNAGDKTYLGKSDIIESLFGKFKYLSNESQMAGITESILLIPTLTGKTDIGTVKEAMQYSKIDKVKEWVKSNIGETVYSKRKKFMAIGNIKSG